MKPPRVQPIPISDLHRPLTSAQLNTVGRKLRECRAPSHRKGPLSPDERLPTGAHDQIVEVLPALLLECDILLLSDITDLHIARTGLPELRRIQSNLAKTSVSFGLVRRPVFLPPDWDANCQDVADKLTLLSESAAYLARVLADRVKSKRKRGRKAKPWRILMLSRLAAWWYRQGWEPTQQPGGCFLTVATILLNFRTGRKVDDDRGWNPSTVRDCIRLGRDLSKTEDSLPIMEMLRR